MTVKTDAQLKAELDTTFYTNGANLSTGALTNTHLTNAIESKVSVIDAESINGVKTFGSFPVTPSSAPTTDYQVANKKYVDEYIRKTTSSIINAHLGIGSEVHILSAPGVGTYLRILNIDMKIIVRTQMEVGSQGLEVLYSGDGVSNELYEFENVAVESASTARYTAVSGSKTIEIKSNTGMSIILSSGTAPSAGDVDLVFNITYEVLSY